MITLLLFTPIIPLPAANRTGHEIIRVDIDHDGTPELFRMEGGVLLLSLDGHGRLVDRTAELGFADAGVPAAAEWYDVDHDGWQDLVTLDTDGVLSWYRNENGRNFTAHVLYEGARGQDRIAWQWSRLDGDKRPDLLVHTAHSVAALLCTGPGRFELGDVIEVGECAPENVARSGRGSASESFVDHPDDRDSGGRGSGGHPGRAGFSDGRPVGGASDGTEPPVPAPGDDGTAGSPPPGSGPGSVNPGVVDATRISPGCADTLRDLATASCVPASSIPMLGALLPLGVELFVDPGGRVGLGTVSPSHARLEVTADMAGDGIYVETGVGGGVAIEAISSSPSDGFGLVAEANSPVGRAVRAVNEASTGTAIGLESVSRSDSGWAMTGIATSASGSAIGVRGQSDAESGFGVFGVADGLNGVGVWGEADSANGVAVRGKNHTPFGTCLALLGTTESPSGVGVLGVTSSEGNGANELGSGVQGTASGAGVGVAGISHLGILGFQPLNTDGVGVLGADFSVVGSTHGIWGEVFSTNAGASGVWGEGPINGVIGRASTDQAGAKGIHGYLLASVTPGAGSAGVRGDIFATSTSGFGVQGKHAGSGIGVMGDCQNGIAVYGISANGTAVFSEGDTHVNGTLTATSKSFVHPHPSDPTKEIRFTCLEGNEFGTYFRGSLRLTDGRAEIDVPEAFRLVTEAEGLTVQLTPVGAKTAVWIEAKGLDRILVRGDRDVDVDYLVHGVRAGFADEPAIIENEHFVPVFEDRTFGDALHPALRQILVDTQIVLPDGTPNRATAARLGWKLRSAGEDAAPVEADEPARPAPQPVSVTKREGLRASDR